MAGPSPAEASPGMWRREEGTEVRRAVALPEQAPFAILSESQVPRAPRSGPRTPTRATNWSGYAEGR